MTAAQNQVSRRLDRILRARWIGAVLLLLGSAAFLLGLGLVFITISYTPEELLVRVRDKPWTQDVFLLLPAPDNYRAIGGAAALIGLVLFGLGHYLRDDDRWSR